MNELLDYMEAKSLLSRYGIKSTRSDYVESCEEAIKFSRGKKIVLKLISEKALHKSRNGLVKVNLKSKEEITNSFDELQKKGVKLKPYKIIAQEMIEGGIEIIIGSKIDQQFGKMILLGLGGIYVETFKDISLRICPINEFDAESMIKDLKSRNIIAPDDKTMKLIKELLINSSKMIYGNNFSEIDLNPIIIHDGSYDAVDIRIIK